LFFVLNVFALLPLFAPPLLLYEKAVLSPVLESAAKSRLREQVRNKNEAVTMLSRSWRATLTYPFHPTWLPPLNYSLQSAACHQRDGIGMAHGETPTKRVLPIGYISGGRAEGKGLMANS